MAKNMAVFDEDRLDTRRLLQVLTAVRKGDFSVRLPSNWAGIDGKIADSLNDIIEMMSDSTKEIERVSRVVGREGKLSQRVAPPPARGSWKSRVDAVNDLIENLVRPTAEMARVIGAVAKGNLTQTVAVEAEGQPLRGEILSTARMVNGKVTAQLRIIADVTIAVANGDLSKKITVDVRGEILQLKEAINTMVDQLRSFAAEVTRVAREVGTDGKLGGQAVVPGVAGTWKDLTDSVNAMAGNLTAQVRNIADVTIAVANGDLSKKIPVDVRGEILQLKEAINTMVDQLRSFASEVTRVAREVGTDGKLGGQAQVGGVGGTWKD